MNDDGNATDAVRSFLRGLQEDLIAALETEDGKGGFERDAWERADGGGGVSRVMKEGALFEQAGVGYSNVHGDGLPPAASRNRPELAGRRFEAMGVSLVLHPRNPYVPTTHANFRFFIAEAARKDAVWWFGGGFDLTPYYPFEEDVLHWHRTARDACRAFGDDAYPRFKTWCDEYFYLPHRNETRGVGGLFFDDLNEPDFDGAFALTRSIAEHFLPAYLPIVRARRDTDYGARERDFQAYRRGRYVEFNLLYDRGTLFGLQSQGRTESILMSLPPRARWEYGWRPEAGSAEARLYERYLEPREWLAGA